MAKATFCGLAALLVSVSMLVTGQATSPTSTCTESHLKLAKNLELGSRITSVLKSSMTKFNYTNTEEVHKALKSVAALVKLHHFIDTLPAASNRLIATKVLFKALATDACVWLQQVLKDDFFECTGSGVERFLSLLEVYATMTHTAETARENCNPSINPSDENCLTS